MESLGTGARGGLLPSLQEGRACRRNGGLQEERACWRNGAGALIINFTYFIMDRDEAIAKGVKVNDTRHSMKRRCPWHDYHGKGTYMLTLVVEGRMPLLGRLAGRMNARPGDGDGPKVVLSELGAAIVKEEIPKIHRYYPQVEVWKVCIMPDHIHLVVRVKEDLRGDQAMESLGTEARGGQISTETMETASALMNEKEEGPIGMTAKREKEMGSLGMVIKGFKMGCNKAYWRIYGMNTAPRKGLFESGYNDKVLLHEKQLEGWKKYLDDNPRRLMVKRMNPELFTVMQNKEVAGRRCQMVGNCFLLDIPDKVAVVVHRRYSEEEVMRLREEWLACGERGGVLVSAAISAKEKEVLREAMNRGYRIVLLRENGFPRLYKPCGESFDACSEGLLLQISPWDYHMEKKTITREQCLELNEMAEKIAEGR